MVEIKKAEKFSNTICSCCQSKDSVYLLRFKADYLLYNNLISVCKGCLKELRDKIDRVLKEEV